MTAASVTKRDNSVEAAATWRGILALLVLAPLCGELLSGSTTPLEWLDPATVVLLVMLYGSGAILVRETAVRWHNGWPSILLLGMAYGIYEEGIVVRSFFDPTWPDLDKLSHYGRWMGVNWIWTICLILFHAVVSITIPIILAELMFPALRGRPWTGRRGLWVFTLLFAAMAPIGILGFGMVAPPLAYVGCVVAIGLLVWLARYWRLSTSVGMLARSADHPWKAALLGFAGMMAFVAAMWVAPELGPPALVSFLICLLVPALFIWWAHKQGVWKWGQHHQWCFVCGALGVWIVLALLAVAGPDAPLGGAVFLIFLLMLGLLGRRVWSSGIADSPGAKASDDVGA